MFIAGRCEKCFEWERTSKNISKTSSNIIFDYHLGTPHFMLSERKMSIFPFFGNKKRGKALSGRHPKLDAAGCG